MASFLDFVLDTDRISEGVKLPLYDKNGKKTDQWLCIRSMYSDEFRASMEQQTAALKRDPTSDVAELELAAQITLVASWSFDEECSPENIKAFLEQAPHIADRIDKAAGNNALFFPTPEPSSLNGQGRKSHSKGNQPAVKEQRAST